MKLINENKLSEAIVTKRGKRKHLFRDLGEDIEKTSKGTWVNKGEEGTHGEFKTKREAREQQKAMFASGYKNESLKRDEIDDFFQKAKKLGLKTLDDLKNLFHEPEAIGKSEKEKLDNYYKEANPEDKQLGINESFTSRSVPEQEALIKAAQNADESVKNKILKNFVSLTDNIDDRYHFVKILNSNDTDGYWGTDTIVRDYIINSIASALDSTKAHMSYDRAKEYMHNKYGTDLDINTYNKIIGLNESVYQGKSGTSGNKMTFEVKDDGTFIVKDGENIILNTKVTNVENTREQIKSMEDIVTLEEDVAIAPTETEENISNKDENIGIAALLIDAINSEWDTIKTYNDLIVNAEMFGYTDVAEVVKDINNEENLHVGQLQKVLETLTPETKAIEDGVQEAEEQLNQQTENIENID